MTFFIGNNANRKEQIFMKTTIKLITNTLIVLCVTLIIALIPTEKEADIYQDTVRLHILANSNGKEDQELKLIIRDKLLAKYGKKLSNSKSTSEAVENINYLREDIENDVNAWIDECGKKYTSEVRLSEEWYDTREYEDFTLPCGYYTSLQVLLGNAEGKNWWCVMYPPLCLDLATEDAPNDDAVINYTKEETRLISKNGYNIRFKLLELISESVAFS